MYAVRIRFSNEVDPGGRYQFSHLEPVKLGEHGKTLYQLLHRRVGRFVWPSLAEAEAAISVMMSEGCYRSVHGTRYYAGT